MSRGWTISQVRWIDGDTVGVAIARGFKSELATIDRAGRRTPIDGLQGNPSAFARAQSGALAYVGESRTRRWL